ncbi:MAG: hypothetical protein Q9184_007553 [Pyrenodesmia sp. 2 TL-2023]
MSDIRPNPHHDESPAKRRKLSLGRNKPSEPFAWPFELEHENDGSVVPSPYGKREGTLGNKPGSTISISANPRLAGQTITPFLAEHIPDRYSHLDASSTSARSRGADPSTKYCYRHRPDLKCRRQADEPSMDQLQHELEDLSQSDQQAVTHVWSLFSAAPAKHRNLMLQGILTQCCFPQLSYLAGNVRELIRIDFLNFLEGALLFGHDIIVQSCSSQPEVENASRRRRSMA